MHHRLLPFPSLWLEPCPGKAAPKTPGESCLLWELGALGGMAPVEVGEA